MADPTDNRRKITNSSESSDGDSFGDRLEKLDERLQELRDHKDPGEAARRDRSALSQGVKIASELVASILVGGIIGWQLDKWLSTTPFLLIIFFLLGTAAGLRSVMRSAAALSKTTEPTASKDSDRENGPGNA